MEVMTQTDYYLTVEFVAVKRYDSACAAIRAAHKVPADAGSVYVSRTHKTFSPTSYKQSEAIIWPLFQYI